MRTPSYELETNTARAMRYGGVVFMSVGGVVTSAVATAFLFAAKETGPLDCSQDRQGVSECIRSYDPGALDRAKTLYGLAGTFAIVGAASVATSRQTDRRIIIHHGRKVFDKQLQLVLDENEEALPVVFSDVVDQGDDGDEWLDNWMSDED